MTVPIEEIVYTFKVNFFIAYPTFENWQDVIFSVNWQPQGTYVDGEKIYEYMSCNRTSVDTSSITDFVPYDQLTEDMVKGWINSSTGPSPTIDEAKESIWKNINAQVNPPPPSTVILPPPW